MCKIINWLNKVFQPKKPEFRYLSKHIEIVK